MFEEILGQQNTHWVGQRYATGVPRSCFSQLLEYLATGQVIAITGVRRAGKSTLVRQLIEHLVSHGEILARNILFLNLEHPYLSPHREDDTALQRIYDDYQKMMQPEGDVIVCLDEVQFFRGWPIFVKAHHETKRVRFVITGSNAAMLSSDMVTLLSGRSLPLEVFPLSFRELAQSRKIDVTQLANVAQKKPQLMSLLEELLEYGGFPTVVLQNGYQAAFDILGAHARTVLLQDVVPRLGLRKPADLEKLYVYLVSNISKPFSYSRLSSLFGLSDKSIKEYLRALVDARLLYEVDLFSYSLKKQLRNPKKAYAIDTGQANAMGCQFSANRGRLLENLIFIDLKRLGFDVYYYRTRNDREVDFVVKKGAKLSLIQVVWDLNDRDTRERELNALQEAMKELECHQTLVLIAEPYLTLPSIDIIPAYQYLLLPLQERKQRIFSG